MFFTLSLSKNDIASSNVVGLVGKLIFRLKFIADLIRSYDTFDDPVREEIISFVRVTLSS